MLNNEQNDYLAQIASSRRTIYNFLSESMLGPASAELIEKLRGEDFLSKLGSFFSEETLEPLRELSASAERTENLCHAIRQDYEDLFNVPGAKYVTPYEAVFRDEREVGAGRVKGLLFGPSTDDVIRFYHVAGLEVSPKFLELPDHIGLELHFMAYLCEQELLTRKNADRELTIRIRETQWGFLDRHLSKWIVDFATRLEERAKTPFFIGIARIAREFILHDYTMLVEEQMIFLETDA